MQPSAILSTNNNNDYLFLLPIVIQGWNIQGWHTHTVMVEVPPRLYDLIQNYTKLEVNFFYAANNILFSNTNPALFTQCIRLYWPQRLIDNNYCILGDADMLICSSFLNRDFDKVNVFGHDLTGYGQIPMCYVGASVAEWNNIMGNAGMRQDLLTHAQPNSNDFYKAWGADQDILTAKLFKYNDEHAINYIPRGTDSENDGLPTGRFDRHNLRMPVGEVHDAHLMRQPYTDKNFTFLNDLLHKLYPQEDWGWLPAYRREFLKLI